MAVGFPSYALPFYPDIKASISVEVFCSFTNELLTTIDNKITIDNKEAPCGLVRLLVSVGLWAASTLRERNLKTQVTVRPTVHTNP